MSSLTVICPNAHRVKVSTNPNMSLQVVLETACTKKGFDSAIHALERNKKRIDLSSTVRFSGIPNNATLEMIKLSDEEIDLRSNSSQEVSVCLQIPSGERMVGTFPSSASLCMVLGRWKEKLGEPSSGEEPVVVYMRREVVGENDLNATTLKNLGLTQGKGLFRFFFKQPEVLKNQANVYDMKIEKPTPPPEERHLPMRLEPEPVKVDSQSTTDQRYDNAAHPSESDVKSECSTNNLDEGSSLTVDAEQPEDLKPKLEASTSTFVAPSEEKVDIQPDSTQLSDDAIVIPVGPNGAIVFSSLEDSPQYQDLGDDFFELSIDEVKSMYKEMKQEVKRLTDGNMLMTKEMREAEKEGEKLSLLSRYKTCILRIQFPSRHVVQGVFLPDTTISEVIEWLAPLLFSSSTPCELYTAPPRTVLSPSATLLDLGLFPASLVHFSSLVTVNNPQYLNDESLSNLSNTSGANKAASDARRSAARSVQGSRQLGLQGSIPVHQELQSIPESRPGKRSFPSENPSGGLQAGKTGQSGKVPKWFKTGK